jgi:hypothetical protein
MKSRLDRLENKSAGRRFTLPDASIVLCGIAMLLATLLTQPFAAGNPARAADAPDADASAGQAQATKAIDHDAADTVERTVFRPELYVPTTGNLSATLEQQ